MRKSELFSLVFGVLLVCSLDCGAASVAVDEAAEAVGHWLRGNAQLGCPLGDAVRTARTCLTTNGVPFHVVQLAGGGFVITSADTEYEPVIAFSALGDFVESAENPLWIIINRDFSARKTVSKTGGLSMLAAVSPTGGSVASRKWERLLSATSTGNGIRLLTASSACETLSDVRVAPLLKTRWGQKTDSYYIGEGELCYNYYTPNNYACGCVATSMAQLMRYHRYPTASVTPGTYPCQVVSGDGSSEEVSLTMQGGVYDWDSMVEVPFDGSTVAQRQAIGKLTSDVGIASRMLYGPNGSAAASYMSVVVLPNRFQYANAVAFVAQTGESVSMETLKATVLPNLNARLPVLMGLGIGGGHTVVVDGYGYSMEALYLHVNMGWAGLDDAWYAPPDFGDRSSMDAIVCNIYPTGEVGRVICSGCVRSAETGAPLSEAEVTAVGGGKSYVAVSDENGIYAFLLNPGSYVLSSSWAKTNVTLSANVGTRVLDDGSYYFDYPEATMVGNRYDCDILVSAEPPPPEPNVAIAFDANGGKTSVASQMYLDAAQGGTYSPLPSASRAGYVFDGWWTAKTGGTRVSEDTPVDLAAFGGVKPTLYAHWLKGLALTLKGANVTAEYRGEIYEKAVSALAGEAVTLRAPSAYKDTKGVGWLFSCWTPAKAYDFGVGFCASTNETTIRMPSAGLAMTATYVKQSESAWLTMYAHGDAVETLDGTIEPDAAAFLWSVDGKSWFPSGTTVLVKKGSYSVQWKSANDLWSAPTAKTKVSLSAGSDYTNASSPVAFTFVKTISLSSVVYTDGTWRSSTAGGSATVKPADGRCVNGKPVTLTAKAAAGYVFLGWQLERRWETQGLAGIVGRNKTLFDAAELPNDGCGIADGKVSVQAVFCPIPTTVLGNFRALLTDAESGVCAGLLELSVTAAGKVSGKVITASGTTAVASTLCWCGDVTESTDRVTLGVAYDKTSGTAKKSTQVSLDVLFDKKNRAAYGVTIVENGSQTQTVLSGDLTGGNAALLTDDTFCKCFLEKYHTVSLTPAGVSVPGGYRTPVELQAPGYLTVTVDKKGTVKVAGKLPDGEKVSASTVLLPAADGVTACAKLFVVPSGYKKQGTVALELVFTSDGAVSASVGAWQTPPLVSVVPDGYVGDLILPGLLSLSADGGVYSGLSDLTGYYLSLEVQMLDDAMPELEYVYTDGAKQKHTASATPTLTAYRLGADQLTGDVKGKITVAKSPAPWKDATGVWHYDETKPDKTGATTAIANPGGLTLAFKPATGVFSGKFNLLFDYEVPQYDKNGVEKAAKREHKSVSCAFEGVVTETEAEPEAMGSGSYAGKFTFANKTYTRKCVVPVILSFDPVVLGKF